jgi:hypothetical protein
MHRYLIAFLVCCTIKWDGIVPWGLPLA